MAWFKVDDGLHDHRKTRRVRRSHQDKKRDVAPFGLWVLAGSWAGANNTNGFVPTEVLEEWDDDYRSLAERLVAAGLWWPTMVDGENGYGFHDWEDRNPANEVDSGRFGNHLRWHVKREITNPDCEFCAAESGPSSPPNRDDDRDESGTTSPPESSPVPTRPDPTKEFDRFWTAYPRKVAKGQARRAWTGAVKKVDDPTSLVTAARAFAKTVRNSDEKFIPHPATWLNGERWADTDGSTLVHLPDGRTVLPPLPPRNPWESA